MRKIHLIANEEDEACRLDSFMAERCEEVSRSSAAALINKGLVFINDKKSLKSQKIKAGDTVTFSIAEPILLDAVAQDIPVDIIYEDDSLLIVHKERGMVVHPSAGNVSNTLVNALMYHCKGNLSSINGVIRPGIVHRIDKDTSGILVVAKTDLAHVSLSEQFAAHSIDRTYYGIVHGKFKEFKGKIDAPIGRHPNDRKKMCVTERNSRNAVTYYEVIEVLKGYSLVKLNLETGRTHQIRVHMAHLAHPIAGDTVYGPVKGIKLGGQCLHAAELGFIHPKTNEQIVFNVPLPEYFEKTLTKLRNASV